MWGRYWSHRTRLGLVRNIGASRPAYPTIRSMATASVAEGPTQVNKNAHAFTRAALEDVLSRRFFYAPAFEIYGGK